MPVKDTREAGGERKRGTEDTTGGASNQTKRAKRLEDGFTAAERCAKRLARQSRARRDARDDRDLTLGEQVLRNPLIRDLSIRGLNPFKLSDLQHILNLRGFYKLLPDVDLKECYFEGAWGFRKDEFVLANWREMSVEEMKEKVRDAHPKLGGRRVYPPGKVDVDTLNTKEEIVRAFWELTYVPAEVYRTAVGGAHVLRSVKAGDVGEDPDVVKRYLCLACRAGLDLPVIRGLAEKCEGLYIGIAAEQAAMGGHTDVLDILAGEFDAKIGVDHLIGAARWGLIAMIDHLAKEYEVDPNGADQQGWTALHWAASRGRVRVVKHLVEKHNVDIHVENQLGWNALDLALKSRRTECRPVLREYGAQSKRERGQVAPPASQGDKDGKKKRKKRKEKDSNAPKRGMSAFLFFSKAKRAEVTAELKAANPDLKGVTDVAKRLGEMWKELSDADKEPFNAQAVADKARYDKEMKAYKQAGDEGEDATEAG